jgi:hypothetical protein
VDVSVKPKVKNALSQRKRFATFVDYSLAANLLGAEAEQNCPVETY